MHPHAARMNSRQDETGALLLKRIRRCHCGCVTGLLGCPLKPLDNMARREKTWLLAEFNLKRCRDGSNQIVPTTRQLLQRRPSITATQSGCHVAGDRASDKGFLPMSVADSLDLLEHRTHSGTPLPCRE